jgi:phosphopantetheinyl transferase (holo-ACP synthase)
MPLAQKLHPDESSCIYIWNVSEPSEALAAHAALAGKTIFPGDNYRTEHRLQHFYLQRILVEQHFPGVTLNYHPSGKPILNNNQHVSFTHSGNYFGAYFSNSLCGIDIELSHSKALKVLRKFLTDDEMLFCNNWTEELALKMWCIKESSFKVVGREDMFLKSHIFVQELPLHHEGLVPVVINNNDDFIKRDVCFTLNNDYCLAYTLPV